MNTDEKPIEGMPGVYSSKKRNSVTPDFSENQIEKNFFIGDTTDSDYENHIITALAKFEKNTANINRTWIDRTPVALAQEIAEIDVFTPYDNCYALLKAIGNLNFNDTVYSHELNHELNHVAYMNCPILLPAITVESIKSTYNTADETYDQSVAVYYIEARIIEWACKKKGFDISHSGGISTGGGKQTNFCILLIARDHYYNHKLNRYNVKQECLTTETGKLKSIFSELKINDEYNTKIKEKLLAIGRLLIAFTCYKNGYQLREKL